MTDDQKQFLALVIPLALTAEAQNPICPACITIAQAILETGWGKARIGNNLWGVKFYKEMWGYEEKLTFEYDKNGNKHQTVANFQTFPTLLDAVMEHTRIFESPYYLQLRAALTVDGWRGFARLLGPQVYPESAGPDLAGKITPGQPPRYSTSPAYGQKIIELVDQLQLDDPAILARYTEGS